MISKHIQKCLEIASALARSYPASIGVDYGYVYKKGKRLKKFGIRFHVPNKISLDRLLKDHVLPKNINGVRCDVIERIYYPHNNSYDVLNPLISGALIGNLFRQTAGTLGFFARDNLGRIGLVSNWHVLEGSLAWGKETIQQPRSARDVATTVSMLEPVTGYDFGFAVLNGGISCSSEILNLGFSIVGVEQPRAGIPVVKYGAATKETHGIIEAYPSKDLPMVYPSLNNQTYFLKAFCITPVPGGEQRISDQGDSGSVWINPATHNVVGLHVGGLKDQPEVAVAHSIVDILDKLGLELFIQ
ncbi:chymotrypsin family serine protease [Pseudomonas lini]|uniref:Serine protease n=1 Tax=Pseudomonas lini TaxID=163011 RepID=A0A1H2B9N0_9PSED|nr:hypothetical protein [Pseudomonas lini]KAB0498258.1 hypothetical protein F7R14_27350 [Pseudomonas lini]SDT54985.1 hypothetical protein SAMN04490191_5118 [Pseudomonas lini]